MGQWGRRWSASRVYRVSRGECERAQLPSSRLKEELILCPWEGQGAAGRQAGGCLSHLGRKEDTRADLLGSGS